MNSKKRKAYIMPKLTIHGTVEKITQQGAPQPPPGKGDFPLDPSQGLPNSKLPNGDDGLSGIHISV